MLNRHTRTVSKLALLAAGMGMTVTAHPALKPFLVYHDGTYILFAPEVTGTRRTARVGSWELGERLSASDENPRDPRLNLYVVVPGGQYSSREHPEYNHTLVVNKYTVDGKPREWDIFWCLVLDPSLNEDLESERALLVAAHERFQTPDTFEIRQVPSYTVMAERLRVTTVGGLKHFRKKDGSLPRLLIVPANLAVRATAGREPVGPPFVAQ